MRVIFAYDSETPSAASPTFSHHDVRGVRSLYMLEPQMAMKGWAEDALTWDVMNSNVGSAGYCRVVQGSAG